MSDDNKFCPPASGNEPEATRSAAPMWIIVTTLVLLFLGGYYFDKHSGWFNKSVYAPYSSSEELDNYQPKSGEAAARARGKAVYESVCGICHGPDGMGKPGQAPPLAGSEWVNCAGFHRLAHIPLMGVNGPLKVEGKDWSLSMAAMGAALSDDDLAAVLTYIRSSWGNKASPVTGDDIKKIRASLGAPKPMTSDELMALPE
ncbi:MAG TPA: cytochrome c [Candidatus Binatia bacterium]|nr:cytochrome c [Candidatus Binatia bacterium]